MPSQHFLINGTVLDEQTRHPIAGIYIEAWDKDLIYDDLVGATTTNQSGEFQFRFDDTYFQTLFLDRRPDIFFKILHNGAVIKSTEDSVLWNVSKPNKPFELLINRSNIQPDDKTIIARAMNYSLEAVLDQFAEGEQLPPELVKEYERELKRFLALASITHKDYGIVGPISRLWRIFVTFTHFYDGFSRNVNGAYLHHFPYVRSVTFPRRRLEDIQASYETMLRDYEQAYQEEPPQHLWPRLVDLPGDTGWSWIDDKVLTFTAANGVSSLGGGYGQQVDGNAAVSGTE